MISTIKKHPKRFIVLAVIVIAILFFISTKYSISMDDLVGFFGKYAYQPIKVYLFVVLLMTASSFGLPIPEEVTLVSVGFIAYMASHPETYPPSTPDAVGVNIYLLAVVSFFAVLLSDLLVYFIGRFMGNRPYFKKKIETGDGAMSKVHNWFDKYGTFAIFFFRFMPGIRFIGHMTCGITKVKLWKFLSIDGIATSISVPTQVLIVAFYGKTIIENIKQFKLILFSVIVVGLIIFYTKKYLSEKKLKQS